MAVIRHVIPCISKNIFDNPVFRSWKKPAILQYLIECQIPSTPAEIY